MNWLVKKGLRVLMYHKVAEREVDYLTVSVTQLAEQLAFLRRESYELLRMSQVVEAYRQGSSLPSRAVLLTFDDAYLNNLTFALPVLEAYQAPATIFVPTAFIGQTSAWDSPAAPLMSAEQLRSLPAALIELGLHSHEHRAFAELDSQQLRGDLSRCIQTLEQHKLPFIKALAYPFGSRPKQPAQLFDMRKILAENGVELAFRIGNRVNTWPLVAPTEINRIDVRGTDSLSSFKRKVRWGKLF